MQVKRLTYFEVSKNLPVYLKGISQSQFNGRSKNIYIYKFKVILRHIAIIEREKIHRIGSTEAFKMSRIMMLSSPISRQIEREMER